MSHFSGGNFSQGGSGFGHGGGGQVMFSRSSGAGSSGGGMFSRFGSSGFPGNTFRGGDSYHAMNGDFGDASARTAAASMPLSGGQGSGTHSAMKNNPINGNHPLYPNGGNHPLNPDNHNWNNFNNNTFNHETTNTTNNCYSRTTDVNAVDNGYHGYGYGVYGAYHGAYPAYYGHPYYAAAPYPYPMPYCGFPVSGALNLSLGGSSNDDDSKNTAPVIVNQTQAPAARAGYAGVQPNSYANSMAPVSSCPQYAPAYGAFTAPYSSAGYATSYSSDPGSASYSVH